MRVAFAGTPDFAAQALRALLVARFELVQVLTQPDRPAGRGLQLQPSPVKRLAQEHMIPVAQPRSLRLDGRFPDDALAARDALGACRPDVLVVAAYGLILPEWALTLPPLGCVNIHASLLPRWRGAAPVQRAIEAGDARTGITIMQMDAGLDTGPMLLQRSLPIAIDETAGSLHDKLAALGGQMIVQALQALTAKGLVPQPQPEHGITYAAKIDKTEARIDWSMPAAAIERRLRALDPAPGAHFDWHGDVVKLWRARVLPGDAAFSGAPGDRIDFGPGRLALRCGQGALELLELQRPGGRRITASQFLQATHTLKGRGPRADKPFSPP